MSEPDSDTARLAALDGYGILDTPPERGFDDIVLLATQICEAPIALVSLVAADRQWFKARAGFDAGETPLSQSICAHTLEQPGLLIIPDLAVDPRTRGNTLVTGAPHARFYAGARLATPTGQALGALCVMDTVARPDGLTDRQATALAALARQVMTQLELHRTLMTLEMRVTEKVRERSRTWQVSPDLFGVLNADGIFESSNPAWQQVLGWTAEHLARTPFFEFLHPDDLPANRVAWREALAGLPVLNFENRYRTTDGSYRWLSWVAVPEDDKIYCSARDITATKDLQRSSAAIEASLLDEKETSALREQFIAVLGHDLRNPLAAIDGGIRLMQRTPLDDKATMIAGMMQASVGRMAGLIDNVMDFARGRLGGGLVLERAAPSPLEPVLRHVIAELQISAPDREILASFLLPSPVACDRRRIGQLVSNLLSNALTYGEPDQPIHVGAVEFDAELELYVANAGAAIPPAVQATIFEPFSRGAMRPSMQGLGLGLYISAQIARAHGGSLTVTSRDEETRFTFRMPLDPWTSATPA